MQMQMQMVDRGWPCPSHVPVLPVCRCLLLWFSRTRAHPVAPFPNTGRSISEQGPQRALPHLQGRGRTTRGSEGMACVHGGTCQLQRSSCGMQGARPSWSRCSPMRSACTQRTQERVKERVLDARTGDGQGRAPSVAVAEWPAGEVACLLVRYLPLARSLALLAWFDRCSQTSASQHPSRPTLSFHGSHQSSSLSCLRPSSRRVK